MACCTTKHEFLIQKGKNFKAYILSFNPDAEVLKYMEQFNETNIRTSIMTLLVPVKTLGTQEILINDLLSKLTISETELPTVKEKLKRYIDMFIEVSLANDE
jgi:hypothetical protein